MAFLKHPDSSRIIRATRLTIQYTRLLARGYCEVPKPAPGVSTHAVVRADGKYPLKRPIQDLGVIMYVVQDLSPEEKRALYAALNVLQARLDKSTKKVEAPE